MTTTALFRDDAYLRSATARVLAVSASGIELDRTIFYPQGGGQAGDTGTLLRGNGERVAVVDTRKGALPDPRGLGRPRPYGDWGKRTGPRPAAAAEGGGTTGPMSPSGASSRSTITGA